MDSSQLALYTVSRFLHVATAIVLVGGTVFVRFVLMPAAAQALSDADHLRLRGGIMAAWKRIIHGGIALLLASGALNYYRVISDQSHKGDALYHALLGTKILLAFGVFFIASALVGRAPGFEGVRQNARKWLAINVFLALLIVALSGFLKVRGLPSRAPAPMSAAAATP